MARIDRREVRLFVLIILPIAIATLGMLWSTSRILNGISSSVDQQEHSRTWQAVQSAFAAAEEHLEGTVTDNAHWDDAARHSYGTLDTDWLSGTWGYPTTDINYDTMYIVDAEGQPIASYHKGMQFSVSPKTYFGEAFQLTLDSLPKDSKTFSTVSTLVNTPDGLTVMAAAPILPTRTFRAIASARAAASLPLTTTANSSPPRRARSP